jgi:hypothetical protein
MAESSSKFHEKLHKVAIDPKMSLYSIDETPYKLRDATTEKAMGCVLDESLKRAQTKKLFEVWLVMQFTSYFS